MKLNKDLNNIDASGRNTASVYIFIYCLNTINIDTESSIYSILSTVRRDDAQ